MTLARQLELLDPPRTIGERFERFSADHPEVYAELVRMARELAAKGHRHLGIGMLWETLRYNVALKMAPADYEAFKLNNDYRSRFARLIAHQEPDLAEVFELRELRSR